MASNNPQVNLAQYMGTLAEAALDLIGTKMMAAQTSYGDAVGGALVDEVTLLRDLVRKALHETR